MSVLVKAIDIPNDVSVKLEKRKSYSKGKFGTRKRCFKFMLISISRSKADHNTN
jgi:ribosomal protein L6P/L9E